jgi:hypothetical protein
MDGRLALIDFKYDKGNSVSDEDNLQLEFHAIGELEKYDWLYGVGVDIKSRYSLLNMAKTYEAKNNCANGLLKPIVVYRPAIFFCSHGVERVCMAVYQPRLVSQLTSSADDLLG